MPYPLGNRASKRIFGKGQFREIWDGGGIWRREKPRKTPQQRSDPMCDVLANLVWGRLEAGVLVRGRAGKDTCLLRVLFCNILFHREPAHEEETEVTMDNSLSSGESVESV